MFKSHLIMYTHTSHNHTNHRFKSLNIIHYLSPKVISYIKFQGHQHHPVKGHFVMARHRCLPLLFVFYMCTLPHSWNICTHQFDPNVIASSFKETKLFCFLTTSLFWFCADTAFTGLQSSRGPSTHSSNVKILCCFYFMSVKILSVSPGE